MYASLLFWLALVMPGYAVVRRVLADDLKSGFLGVIGLSYLVTFGLLSPVSIACYVLHAPLWVFSAACVLAVVAALADLTRHGGWKDAGRLILGGITLELLIVVADLVMGARVGALVGGDAVTHLARIRVLLDHGFNNEDPFIGGYFFPIYHTNLLHALYAACSQLTGIQHVWVWYASLAWGKLLIAAGCYYMAWSVFDRPWVGWIAAVFTIGVYGPVDFLIYPNKLAPLWILPLMIGFAVQACQSPCTWRSPVKLAVGSLVIGQVHSLYGAFAGIALGPVLAVAAAVRIIRRRPGGSCLSACIVALMAAAPFLLISQATTYPKSRSATEVKAEAETDAAPPEAADKAPTERVTMKPVYGWGLPEALRSRSFALSVCLAVGIVCAMAGSRRKQAAVLLAVAGTVAMIFYVPPFRALAIDILGKKWILGRMGAILYLGFLGLVPGSAAFLLEPVTPIGWLRWMVSLPGWGLRAAIAQQRGRSRPPALPGLPPAWPIEAALYRAAVSVLALLMGMTLPASGESGTWGAYWTKAAAPRAVRHEYLEKTRKVMAFCEKNIPRGVTVLVEEWRGMVLTVVHDCHIVAPRRASLGVPDLPQRREDLQVMLAADTPWETRRALLRKYDIKHFFPATEPTEWTQGHTLPREAEPGFKFFILDTR